jgi:hypothetical protein
MIQRGKKIIVGYLMNIFHNNFHNYELLHNYYFDLVLSITYSRIENWLVILHSTFCPTPR